MVSLLVRAIRKNRPVSSRGAIESAASVIRRTMYLFSVDYRNLYQMHFCLSAQKENLVGESVDVCSRYMKHHALSARSRSIVISTTIEETLLAGLLRFEAGLLCSRNKSSPEFETVSLLTKKIPFRTMKLVYVYSGGWLHTAMVGYWGGGRVFNPNVEF